MNSLYREQADFFRKNLNTMEGLKSFWPSIGHFCEKHTRKSDKELIERMIKNANEDGVVPKASSVFLDKNSALNYIRRALRANAANIMQWKDDNTRTYAFKVSFRDETVGTGFMPDLSERTTNTIRVVLERDRNTTNGMHVLTAYPDLRAEGAKETGRNGYDILKETDVYKNASVMFKVYSENMSMPGMSISYLPPTYNKSDCVLIKFIDKNERYTFMIKEDSCTCRKQGEKMEEISMGEAYLHAKEKTRQIQQILHFRDQEVHERFAKEHPSQTKQLDNFLARRDEIRGC